MHLQATSQGHILLTSQPGTLLSLPSSFWATPFVPALGHSSGPPGPTAPHGPTWQVVSCLPPSPFSCSARPPVSPLPPREGLDPLTLPICSFRPWGLCPPPSTRSLHSLHGRPCPQPSGLFCGLPSSPSLGTSPTPPSHLPATCPATFGASRRAGHSRETAGGACRPCHQGSGRAAWPHPPHLLRPASVLSSQGRKEL